MSQLNNLSKAVIIGAGRVGSTLAYALSLKLLFHEIVLIDIDEKKAHGEAMDLNHGLSYYENLNIYSGNYSDTVGASFVLITSGASQKPGQTRLDLVKQNTEIIKDIIPKILNFNKSPIIMLVTNPVDVLTYVTLQISGLPKNQVLGTGTSLDTARFKYLLGQYYKVSPTNVHAYIIGEHGDSEVPLFSSATIAGIPISEFRNYNEAKMFQIFDQTRTAAYKLLEAKGSTHYAIGLVTTEIVAAILRNQSKIFPVSTLVNGHYGIRDVCLSLPVVLDSTGVRDIVNAKINDYELAKLQQSAEVLRKTLDSVGF